VVEKHPKNQLKHLKQKQTKAPKAEPKKAEAEDDEVAAATKAISSDETAKELGSTPEEKKVKFNQFLSSVKKNKDDKAKIDGILKLAKDKFKFSKTMMDDLKRAAGREVEA
jgi:Tfp pilus assembly protein PilE